MGPKGSPASHTRVSVLSLLLVVMSIPTALARPPAQPLQSTNNRMDFGYGLSVSAPQGAYAFGMGFNWIKVYDPPTSPQPTKVLYRVKINSKDRYDL